MVSCSAGWNWLVRFSIEERAARKPLFAGYDRSQFKQTAYRPTVEEDRREGVMTRAERMGGGGKEERRSKSGLVRAEHGKQDAGLELSKQHSGIDCMLGSAEGFRQSHSKLVCRCLAPSNQLRPPALNSITPAP